MFLSHVLYYIICRVTSRDLFVTKRGLATQPAPLGFHQPKSLVKSCRVNCAPIGSPTPSTASIKICFMYFERGGQRVCPIAFQLYIERDFSGNGTPPYPDAFHGLFTRRMCEINAADRGNIPSGISGRTVLCCSILCTSAKQSV